MAGILAFVGLLAVVAIGSMWRGYALTILWAWFVVPVFGLPTLAIAPAIGVSLVVGFLTHQYRPSDVEEDSDERMIKAATYATLAPLFALAFGWCIKVFM